MKTLYVIPARAGSRRLPGKNTAELDGIPLYMHTVNFVLDVADSDSDSCIVVWKKMQILENNNDKG